MADEKAFHVVGGNYEYASGPTHLRQIAANIGACLKDGQLIEIMIESTDGEFKWFPFKAFKRGGRYVYMSVYKGITSEAYIASHANNPRSASLTKITIPFHFDNCEMAPIGTYTNVMNVFD